MIIDASFWLMVSFFLMVMVGGRWVYRALKHQLTNRSDEIARQIREISDLHEEAQNLYFRERTRLKKTRMMADEALRHASDLATTIMDDTKKKVEILKAQQRKDLERRYGLMENKLMGDIQEDAAEKICSLTEAFVLQKLTQKERDSFVESQVKHIKLTH